MSHNFKLLLKDTTVSLIVILEKITASLVLLTNDGVGLGVCRLQREVAATKLTFIAVYLLHTFVFVFCVSLYFAC